MLLMGSCAVDHCLTGISCMHMDAARYRRAAIIGQKRYVPELEPPYLVTSHSVVAYRLRSLTRVLPGKCQGRPEVGVARY